MSLLRCLQGQSTLRHYHFRDSRHLLRVISTPQNLVLALPSCTDPTDRERARMPALRLPPRQSQTSQLSIVTPRWPPANSRLPLTSCNTSQGEEPASRPKERSDGRSPLADPSISLAHGTRRLSADRRPTHVGVTCDFFGRLGLIAATSGFLSHWWPRPSRQLARRPWRLLVQYTAHLRGQ